MKNKKTLPILLLTFIFLLAGASVLYNSLGKTVKTDSLVTQSTPSDNTSSLETSEHENENHTTDNTSDTNTNTNTNSDSTNNNIDNANSDSENNNNDNSNSDSENNNNDNSNSDSENNNNDNSNSDSENNNNDNANSDSENNNTSTTANPAPDFTVTDLNGNKVNLSDFIGKPVILNFWASWCGPCKSEMPDFDAAYAKYKDNIHFLMVNLTDGTRETVDVASSYIAEQGYTFPVYYDTLSEASITYSVYSIPTTYFIDAAGNLIAQAQGAINSETLQTGIDMIYY